MLYVHRKSSMHVWFTPDKYLLVSNYRKYVHDIVTVCLHENTVCTSYCQHATKHHYMKDGTTVMYSYGGLFHAVPWLGSHGLGSPRGAP